MRTRTAISAGFVLACVALLGLAHVRATASETITAMARVKSAAGADASAPVSVVVDRFSTDGERDELMAALKKGGTAAVRDLLAGRAQIGSVQVGGTNTAIKYVYARAMGDGRLITAVTGSPIAFIGAGLPGAKPTTGFDLGLVLLEVAASGPGRGEIVPAAKIKLNDQGAIVTDDYSSEVVQLSNVVRK